MMQVSAAVTPAAAWLWNWRLVMLSMKAFCFSSLAVSMLLLAAGDHVQGSSPSMVTGLFTKTKIDSLLPSASPCA